MGEFLGEAYWQKLGKSKKPNLYVIRVFTEENEPLFWHESDRWIDNPDDAVQYTETDEAYLNQWVPFYAKDVVPHYVLLPLAQASVIGHKILQGEYLMEINEYGNQVIREFKSFGEDDYGTGAFIAEMKQRYPEYPDTWHQIVTNQNAPYFCYVYSAYSRIIANYCEGDKTIIVAENAANFMAEMECLDKWLMSRGDSWYAEQRLDLDAIRKEAEANEMWELWEHHE